jgi:glycine dehydrogenase subunit 2
LIVPEALMIEPTETESLETLEDLAQAFERVAALSADHLTHAPYKTPVGRVDEARAARQLIATEDMRPQS